jgi:DeoR/GlpR family transcriptional regulator of sugar metabolism
MAKGLFIDMAFFGTKAFVPTEGTFESSLPTFRLKQIVAERCNRVVLLVDHSKMGQRALSKVLDITQIHTVVTDDQVLPEDLALLTKAGPKVIIAPRLNSRLERTADVA